MPNGQQQDISDETLQRWIGMSPDARRTAMSSLDDETKQALLSRVEGYKGAAAGATSLKPRTFKDKMKEYALSAAEYLPGAGGAIGGALGGIPGAAAGGVAGKSGQRLLETAVYGKEPTGQTPTEALTELGVEGAKQGAQELGGRALAKGARIIADPAAASRFAARPLNRLLRMAPSEFSAAESLAGESPGIELLKQPGIEKVGTKYELFDFINKRIPVLEQQKKQLLQAATQAGRTVDVETPFRTAMAEAKRVPVEYEEGALRNAINDFQKRWLTKQGNIQGLPIRVSRGLDQAPLDEALQFRQDLREAIGKWESQPASRYKATMQKAYKAVTDALHAAAPEIEAADTAQHQLIFARQAAERRIEHLESGTLEQSAGKTKLGRTFEKLPLSGGYLTVPEAVNAAKARQAAVKVTKPLRRAMATDTGQAIIKGGMHATRSPMTPPPDEDEE